MRIALVTRRFPPLIGGAEAMLRYLAIALADEGAEVTVVTSRPGGLAPEEWIGGKVRDGGSHLLGAELTGRVPRGVGLGHFPPGGP